MSKDSREAFGPTPNCPDLEALARSPLAPQVERHVGTCAHCRTELALLHEFENAEATAEESRDVDWIVGQLPLPRVSTQAAPAKPGLGRRIAQWLAAAVSPRPSWALAGVAAAVLLTVGSVMFLNRQDTGLRAPVHSGDNILRSGRMSAVAPAGEISSAPAELRWEAAPGAARYRVQLMGVDGAVIWSGESMKTTIDIPSEIRAQMSPGRAFQWRATAMNAAGESIASTDLQIFHIPATHR